MNGVIHENDSEPAQDDFCFWCNELTLANIGRWKLTTQREDMDKPFSCCLHYECHKAMHQWQKSVNYERHFPKTFMPRGKWEEVKR